MQKGEQPGTANREAPIPFVFSIIGNPYFSSDTAYGMFDSSMNGLKYGLQYKEGMPLTLDPQFIDYDTKEMKYTSGMDFAYGWNDVRNWVLSDGTNA